MKKFFLLLLTLSFAVIGSAPLVFALGPEGDTIDDLDGENYSLTDNAPSLPTLGLEDVSDPLEAVDSVLLNYVINPIFFLAGGVAVIVIMYAAFQMIKGQGEEEAITNAKNTLIWAFAGLGLVLLSYTIVTNLVEIVLTQL